MCTCGGLIVDASGVDKALYPPVSLGMVVKDGALAPLASTRSLQGRWQCSSRLPLASTVMFAWMWLC